MAALGQLVVSLSANIAQFQQSMDKASYLAEKNFNKIQSAAKTAAAAVTVYLSLNQVKDAIKAQLDYADQLAKTSQKVGVATETLSAYAYAAELAGVNFEQLQKSLIFLSKGSVDAARGIGEAKDAFDAMGIKVKDANGNVKSNSVLLEEVADKFAKYKDGAEKTAIAVKVFGKAGADMIPLLNGGSAAIKEAREEAEKFGIIIGGDFAKRAEAVNDNFTRLQKAGQGLALLFAENLLPKLENITRAMIDAAKEGGVLQAVLVGIGGVMTEAFSDSKIQQLNKLNTYLTQAQESWRIFKEQADMTGMTPQLDKQLLKIESRIKSLKEQIDKLSEKEVKPAAEKPKEAAPILLDPAAIKKAQEEASKAATLLGQQFQEAMDDAAKLESEIADLVTKYYQRIRDEEKQTEDARMKAWLEFIDTQQEIANTEAAAAAGFIYETGEPIKKELNEMQQAALEFGARLTSSFEDAILRGAKLRDIMQGLLQDIIKIAVRKIITEPLGNAIAKAIGARAMGGPVSGGTSYLVGERGPEIFTPAVSGNITPNNEIGGGVTIYQNINISTGVAQTVRAEVVGMMPRIMEATKAAVVDSKRRGGSFAKAFS